MLAVIFDLEPTLAQSPECERVLVKLAKVGVPHVVLRERGANADVLARVIRHFGLPAHCIWYVTDKSDGHAKAVQKNGLQLIRVGHDCESISGVLDVLAEPYTRSAALALRYILEVRREEN